MKRVVKKDRCREAATPARTASPAGQLPVILTPRQVQILRLIESYRDRSGCSPTLQEMAQTLRVSKVTVFEHVEALVRKGLLHRAPNKARSLTLDSSVKLAPAGGSGRSKISPKPDNGDDFPAANSGGGMYPMAGYIAAGVPLEAIEIPDMLDVSGMFETSEGTFALCVRGDSMVGEHICDGDFVLVRKANQAQNGQIVVAILEDGQATLKKIYRDVTGFRLEGANPSFKTIYTEKVNIQGVVIGVLRQF
jgi:repressor LexA